MKLRSTQIIGLVAIVVFGGILVFTLINRSDTDRLPSGVRLSDLPVVPMPTTDSTPPPVDPLAVGSQDAKDDLYCSGVVFGAALEGTNTPADQALKLNSAYAALAEGGRAKLVAEKAVTESNAITVGNAWADQARAEDCA